MWRLVIDRFFSPVDTPSREAVFRVAIFSVFALDTWLQIPHAPRYGAGGFNVSHLPVLDGILPLPSRPVILALFLAQILLAIRAALGVRLAQTLVALTVCNSISLFWSQLDSWQHHFFVWWVLLAITGSVVWERADRIPGWGLRTVLAQVSILYAWTAVAKSSPLWTSGLTFSRQVGPGWVRDGLDAMNPWLGPGALSGYALAANLVLAVQVFLAVAIWIPRLRWAAVGAGLAFHVGVEVLDFRIGLFSYYMFGLYLLVVPSWVVERLGRGFRVVEEGDRARWPGLLGGALMFAGLLSMGMRDLWWVTLVPAGVLMGVDVVGGASRRAAVAGAMGGLLVGGLATVSPQVRDHYRYHGGFEHRSGNLDEAITAYELVTRIDPSYLPGWRQLASLYAERGELDRARQVDAYADQREAEAERSRGTPGGR